MKTILNNRLKKLLNYFSPSVPVTAPESLKGRDREVDDALMFLLNEECIIVQGARRIGKTSFLHCLGKLCSEQDQHSVYISFQGLSQYNGETFTEHLRRQLSMHLEIPNNSLKTVPGIYDSMRRFGQFLDNKCKSDEHFILFLDEFQLTERFPESERYLFYNQLRDVIEERVIQPELRRFIFVISTSQSLSELSVGISSTLASSFPKTFSLGRISSDSCRDLIRYPFSEMVEIEDDATDLITYESGGHPYLIKLLLHNIIIRNAADFSSDPATSVNRKMVETQVTVLTEDLVHPHFEMLKNVLNEVEIQILYEIDKHRTLGFLDIREAILFYFAKFRRNDRASSVRIALDRLQNLQILQKENELFCLASGVYQKWFSAFFEQYYVNEAIQEFRKLKLNHVLPEFDPVSSPDEFVQIIHKAILYLKKAFEEKGLWELVWKDKSRRVAHHERYLQKMTAALLDTYLAPYNIIVEREVESGVGPMDIKLILCRSLTACLEIKKSTGDVYHGLEVEMNAYMGSAMKIGFFVLFYIGGRTKSATITNKLESIVKKITMNQPDKVIQTISIDCVPKKSASKKFE